MSQSARLFLAALGIAAAVFGQSLYGHQKKEPVEVQISELKPTPVGVDITLRDLDSRKSIHMLIGFSEGQSIMQAMRGQHRGRPMTHDLMKNFLDRNDWTVDRVLIRDLVRGTFRANLILVRNGETQIFDARPSDAMAIGLRYGAKIFVNEEVFEQQKEYEDTPEEHKSSEPETLRL
jgi:bifunctional DNase/RNase